MPDINYIGMSEDVLDFCSINEDAIIRTEITYQSDCKIWLFILKDSKREFKHFYSEIVTNNNNNTNR